MEVNESQAARGTSILFVQSVVSGILRVANIMILTRLLVQAEMGQIAVFGIIYGMSQFIGALGLNHATPLVIPKELSTKRLDRIKGFLRRSVILITFSSLLLIIVLLLMQLLGMFTGILNSTMVALAAVIIPFSALEAFLDSFLLGKYDVRRLVSGRLFFDATRVTISVFAVLLGAGVTGVIAGWLSGEIVAVLIFGISALRGLPSQSTHFEMRPVLAFALSSLSFQAVDVTIQNTDRLILLYLTDLATLGVYDVILGVLFMMSFVSLAVSTSVYPILTRARLNQSDANYDSMQFAVGTLLRYIFMLLVPLAMIASLNSYTLLRILFGISYAEFPDAPLSFSILLLTYALWGLVYALHTVLRSYEEARFFVTIGLFIFVFEVIVCWYLTMLFGLLGSAMTRAAYVTILFLASFRRLAHHNIPLSNSLAISVAKIVSASLLAAFVPFLFSSIGTLQFIFAIFVSLFLYLVLLFSFREVQSTDFRFIRYLTPSKFHGMIDSIEHLYERWAKKQAV